MKIVSQALRQMKTAFILLILLTILTGLIYPLIVTGIAQLFFSWKANGSFIEQDGKIIGSQLIGQPFDAAKYFWPRPSATTPFPYNAASSTGSNMGPSNPTFLAIVKERIHHLHESDPKNNGLIPVDLVTASGSGLDPDISPYAALYQVPRIAKINNIPENEVALLIKEVMKKRSFAILGEPRVNVLELNIALNRWSTHAGKTSQSR